MTSLRRLRAQYLFTLRILEIISRSLARQ